MGVETIVTVVVGLAGTVGGFVGGRKSGSATAVGTALDTVELLQVQIDLLKNHKEEKDAKLIELGARVEVLEGLVTQRAEVDALRESVLGLWEDVEGVRGVVDRIATKVDA